MSEKIALLPLGKLQLPADTATVGDSLAVRLEETGWTGAPAVVVEAGDFYHPWTLADRIGSARQAGVEEIPCHVLSAESLREAGYDPEEAVGLRGGAQLRAARLLGDEEAIRLLLNERAHAHDEPTWEGEDLRIERTGRAPLCDWGRLIAEGSAGIQESEVETRVSVYQVTGGRYLIAQTSLDPRNHPTETSTAFVYESPEELYASLGLYQNDGMRQHLYESCAAHDPAIDALWRGEGQRIEAIEEAIEDPDRMAAEESLGHVGRPWHPASAEDTRVWELPDGSFVRTSADRRFAVTSPHDDHAAFFHTCREAVEWWVEQGGRTTGSGGS
jgi:hypothetical protein